MTNEQFSIPILPNNNPEDPSKIVFTAKHVKCSYVNAEYRALREVYLRYWNANTPSERKKTFANLSKMRIVFAKQRGYGPDKLTPNIWKLITATPPISIA